MHNRPRDKPGPQRLPEAVRDAVARTVQATIGSAQSTRDRAQEAVDEVVRRAETGAGVVTRSVRGAFEEARPATNEDLRRLREQLSEVADRLEQLEKRLGEARDRPQPRKQAGPAGTKRAAHGSKKRDDPHRQN